MNIQKTSGMNAGAVTDKVAGKAAGKAVGKTAVEQLVQKTAMSKLPQTGPPMKSSVATAVKPLSLLMNAAGLPADKLSAGIISFARFFSLPLKPELMASIRRQSLSPETSLPNRETLSLAAAAAESKGVELRPKGLEWFAEAIDPDWRRQNPEERERRERRHKRHGQENAPKTRPLSAISLKEMVLESAAKYSTEATASEESTVALLNKIPGKNGQRWMVFPFSFDESGREFRVSLRILLSADKQPPNNVSCMALDIAETGRRWLVVMNPAKAPRSKLSVYLQPELSPQAIESFIGQLSRAMEMPREHISVKKWTESFPCEAGGGENLLRSVNEAV